MLSSILWLNRTLLSIIGYQKSTKMFKYGKRLTCRTERFLLVLIKFLFMELILVLSGQSLTVKD